MSVWILLGIWKQFWRLNFTNHYFKPLSGCLFHTTHPEEEQIPHKIFIVKSNVRTRLYNSTLLGFTETIQQWNFSGFCFFHWSWFHSNSRSANPAALKLAAVLPAPLQHNDPASFSLTLCQHSRTLPSLIIVKPSQEAHTITRQMGGSRANSRTCALLRFQYKFPTNKTIT